MTRGRHNFKFGFYTEWTSKTEPGAQNYMGNYNFGHDAQNSFSTGNGYANALLGVFTTYTEQTNRFDKRRRHWQTEGYVQDSWRMKPRLTLDYGVRLTHSGRVLRHEQLDGGLLRGDWDRAQAARPVPAVLHDPTAPGTQTCAAANQRAYDQR